MTYPGSPELTTSHLDLNAVLRMRLAADLPPGSWGRITPAFPGSGPTRAQSSSPGEKPWMGDLPPVRAGYAAVIAAAKMAWWWKPLHKLCQETDLRPEVVRSREYSPPSPPPSLRPPCSPTDSCTPPPAVCNPLPKPFPLQVGFPLARSHDATNIGNQDRSADPILARLIAATGRFGESVECIQVFGFLQKLVIGEHASKQDRARVLENWQQQLYRAFSQEMDDYFSGMPLLMREIPGLIGGRKPKSLFIVLPYNVVFVLDWS